MNNFIRILFENMGNIFVMRKYMNLCNAWERCKIQPSCIAFSCSCIDVLKNDPTVESE